MRNSPQVFIGRFRCPSQAAARQLVDSLLVDGLHPELHEPPLPDQAWEVAVPVQVAAMYPDLELVRAAMAAAAERFGAAFDGCDQDV